MLGFVMNFRPGQNTSRHWGSASREVVHVIPCRERNQKGDSEPHAGDRQLAGSRFSTVDL